MKKLEMTRAVFLDRDGVINRAIVKQGKPYPPPNVEEVEILPGVLEGILLIKQAGFLIIVVTNQPDVAKGLQKREVVEEINSVLKKALPIDEVFVCYHDNSDNCECRKPRPGLLLEAKKKYHIDLSNSYLIGDRWKDIEAGRRVNCTTFFIDYKYSETNQVPADYNVTSLFAAAKEIMRINTFKNQELKNVE